MKRWYGKILGACLGVLLMRVNPLFGALLGLLLGHALDADWFGRASPYRVLGISTDASDAEVEQAWRRLISQYHPDKYVNAAPELRARAERAARDINTAYEKIQKLRKKSR
ncbi:hypothetical protein CO615_05655 [Lysobacteraceae bacterium NML75-0749]|nr:hypothetical protein CO615_05655 [Xanthomonadaceae bacterium NML75-0749]PJK04848.1 hypothetical protein CO609_04100 [Xanthomonadaceae bacterium NML91-0268]